MEVELVKFKNRSGLYLDGIYFNSPANHHVIIHVHGSFGNFYSNPFIKTMAQVYNSHGINFLSFNLTQHDGIAEAVRENNGVQTWEYIGYAISDYDTCVDDIAGAIDYVKIRHNDSIVLQGHSLGCNRVLYYLIQSKSTYPIVLLSPTNSLELQRRWVFPETIEQQIARLKMWNNNTNISYVEHGVNTSGREINKAEDTCPFIPISGQALLSMLENQSMDIVRMLITKEPVVNPAFIYLGESDEYQTDKKEKYIECFDHFFSKTTYKILANGNHSFHGYEEELAICISEWANKFDMYN